VYRSGSPHIVDPHIVEDFNDVEDLNEVNFDRTNQDGKFD